MKQKAGIIERVFMYYFKDRLNRSLRLASKCYSRGAYRKAPMFWHRVWMVTIALDDPLGAIKDWRLTRSIRRREKKLWPDK